jgi:hypothetical protein
MHEVVHQQLNKKLRGVSHWVYCRSVETRMRDAMGSLSPREKRNPVGYLFVGPCVTCHQWSNN